MSEATAKLVEVALEEPDIYGYHNYRVFLQDWFEFLRESDPGFSLRNLAQKSGLSTGYLPMFLSGAIGLSSNAMGKIITFLGLSTSKRNYLKLLRSLAEASTQDERLESLKKIQKFRAYQKLNPNEVEIYRYMTHWYYVAIREMASLPDFNLDAKWVQSKLRFKVPLKEVEEAITFLRQNKYIRVQENGNIVLSDNRQIKCVGGVYKLVLTKFHYEMLNLAQEAIQNTPSDERFIVAHTVALSHEKFDQAREIMQEALNKIEKLGDASEVRKSNNVYHFELAGFPLTESNGRGRRR